MRKKAILTLLCGIWAFALGSRYTAELLASDGWLHIPAAAGGGVNIWFDFAPLAAFGLAVVLLELREAAKEMMAKRHEVGCWT